MKDHMHFYSRAAKLAALGGLALAATACTAVSPQGARVDLPLVASEVGQTPLGESISVTGFGEAVGRPDMATVQLVVEVKADSITQAIDESNQTVERLTRALLEFGIAETDLQSTGFSVWPEDLWDHTTGQPTGERLYHVDSTLTVTIRQIDKLSQTIQTGLNSGATNVWGLSYGIGESAELEAKARSLALADARDRGEQLAEALGVSLGQPQVVSELAGTGLIPLSGFAFASGMGGGGGPPLSPGELTVRIQVDIVYSIEK